MIREHIELVKCICAYPDWLTWRGRKGVLSLSEDKGRCWELEDLSAPVAPSQPVCSIMQFQHLSKKMYTEHQEHNVQAEGGRHVELTGHYRWLQTQQKIALTYWFHLWVTEGNEITCSIGKQSTEQHQKNNNVRNHWIKQILGAYVGYTGGVIRVPTFEQQSLSVSNGKCWHLNVHRPYPAKHNTFEIHEKMTQKLSGSLGIKGLVLHGCLWNSTLI